ncbi:MAG: hypothetical protein WCC36_12325, partial [Gammaproteobacteria bacterium]
MRTLTVVVPGLLGPLQGMGLPGFPRPAAPATERLLARAHRDDGLAEGFEATLCELFGLQGPEAALPLAAITRLADTGERDRGWWLRVDPVHLRADQSRLVLFDSRALDIEPDEADALLTQLRALYEADDGWRLEAPVPGRWYVRTEQAVGVQTTPVTRVIGHHIDPYLPAGKDGTHWHRVLNEVQMLFHDQPVNAARDSQGRPTINSVWFWGGGRLPQLPAASWRRVWSDDPLAMGLATLAGVERSDRPAGARDWLARAEPGAHLVVLDQLHSKVLYDDLDGWVQAVEALERTWLAPLAEALARGRLTCLEILPCNGRRYRAGRLSAWRLWHR